MQNVSAIKKLAAHMHGECKGKYGLPNTQFKLVKQVRHKHLIKIKVIVVKKRVWRGCSKLL